MNVLYALITHTIYHQHNQCNLQRRDVKMDIYNVSKEVSALRFGIGPVNALWSSALQTVSST